MNKGAIFDGCSISAPLGRRGAVIIAIESRTHTLTFPVSSLSSQRVEELSLFAGRPTTMGGHLAGV
jgi:hypothetical protein